MSKRNSKKKEMQCNPKCTYFPNMECYHYEVDKNGVKRRADGRKFICGYDGHEIKDWYAVCPLKEIKEK